MIPRVYAQIPVYPPLKGGLKPVFTALQVSLSLHFVPPQTLTIPLIYATMSTLLAESGNRSYNVTWDQLKKDLLALPYASEPGEDPLFAKIRRLTGNLFWEDICPEVDHQRAAVYLFKKVADDIFFNFGQDASVSLDLKLDDDREVLYHVEDALAPLVKFVQASLSDAPWEETAMHLYMAAAKYLELVIGFSGRRILSA